MRKINNALTELQSRLALLETKFTGLQTTLISPDKMPELLRNLLKKNGKLKLIELQTLPVKGLLENASEDKEQTSKQELPVYKHGVEITIEGRYLDLLDYVPTGKNALACAVEQGCFKCRTLPRQSIKTDGLHLKFR